MKSDSASIGAIKIRLVNTDDPAAVLDEVGAIVDAKKAMLPHAGIVAAPEARFSEKEMLSQEIEILEAALKYLHNNSVDAALRKLDECQHYCVACEEGKYPVICEGCMPGGKIIF